MADNKSKEHLVKIKYDYDHMSENERKGLCAAVGILAIIVLGAAQVGFAPGVLFQGIYLMQEIVMLLIFFATLVYYIVQRNKRMQRKRLSMMIKEHGKKIIGEIVSMSETTLNSRKENFSFDIEYENPESGEIDTVIITPSVLRTEMYIKEKDLPLKVIVYLHNGMTHVDAVINPPLAKMTIRKFAPIIIIFLLFVVMALCFIAAMLGYLNLYIYTFIVIGAVCLGTFLPRHF